MDGKESLNSLKLVKNFVCICTGILSLGCGSDLSSDSQRIYKLSSLQTSALWGKMQWSLWPESALWPSVAIFTSLPTFKKYNERQSRILVRATLGFVGFSPPAAESVSSSNADQACLSLLRHHLFHCDLEVVVPSHAFHSNSHDGFWDKLLDSVSSPENVPNRNVLFSHWIGLR